MRSGVRTGFFPAFGAYLPSGRGGGIATPVPFRLPAGRGRARTGLRGVETGLRPEITGLRPVFRAPVRMARNPAAARGTSAVARGLPVRTARTPCRAAGILVRPSGGPRPGAFARSRQGGGPDIEIRKQS